MNIIIQDLIQRGNDMLSKPFVPLTFTKDPKIDKYLNDIEKTPHFFVLACLMDRQMKAERAWKIPYFVSLQINNFTFNGLKQLSEKDIKKIFVDKKLHRFNETMAIVFYKGIHKISEEYNDNASLIWEGYVSSATIVKRFLQFDGVGIKIASMAANILAREFKIKMKDRFCIDISPDVHVMRVFSRLGLISKNASIEELIYCARELHPEYPGIFDLSAWEIGHYLCRPQNPVCSSCFLNLHCPKVIN
jgi:endonuclease-3